MSAARMAGRLIRMMLVSWRSGPRDKALITCPEIAGWLLGSLA
jgi:hypothetical protein